MPPEGPIAILAGAGRLPVELVEHLEKVDSPFRVMAMRGFAERALTRRADAVANLLDVGPADDHLDRLRGAAQAQAQRIDGDDAGAGDGSEAGLQCPDDLLMGPLPRFPGHEADNGESARALPAEADVDEQARQLALVAQRGHYRLDLAQLVTEISATLAAAPAGEMDTAVRDALARVARELGFDTASLVELTDDPRVARVTRSVALSGGQPLSGVLAVDRFPWTLAALRRGDLVQWSTRDGIPSAAQEDRTSFAALGTQGFVALPLTVGQTVVGALSLSKASPIPRWPERPIQELRLLADAFTHVIERRRARTALRESEERLRIMADTAPAHVDITRRRLAETAAGRELGHEHLTRALHVRALGDLTTSMAHEISQPLAAILSNAQAVRSILHRQVAVDADVDGALTDMAHDAKRAAFLIRRLRVLLRDDGAEPRKPVDLNEVTAEVTSVVHTELEPNGIVLQLALDSRLPPVLGDAVELQQVILNLLRNGSDAMVDVRDRPRQLLIMTERDDGDRVRLSVRDAGVGLSPQSLGSLFEPFSTTKRDGMGIGLFVSRSIVERHDGQLWAEPNEGGPGATFSFSIPHDADSVMDGAPAVRTS